MTTEPSRVFVLKLGSSSVTTSEGPDPIALARAMVECSAAQRCGWSPLIVTSGSQALGKVLLGEANVSRSLAAAIGQPELMQMYRFNGDTRGLRTCQILVSQADLRSPESMRRLGELLRTACDAQYIPIVNGNDPTDPEPLNNDDLAAAIAIMTGAEQLLLLTDVTGVLVRSGDDVQVASTLTGAEAARVPNLGRSTSGSGGMKHKLEAAVRAANSGLQVCITRASDLDLLQCLDGEGPGTRLGPWSRMPSEPKDRWVAGAALADGRLTVNLEAETNLRAGQTLFSSGIKRVSGTFRPGDVVDIIDPRKELVGRGQIRVSDRLVSLLRALTPTEAAAVCVSVLVHGLDDGVPLEASDVSVVSDRTQFTSAMATIDSLSTNVARELMMELLSLVPLAAGVSLGGDGTPEAAASVVAAMERHTAYLGLINRASVVMFDQA